MENILKRRSVREFDLTKKISLTDLKKLCACAAAGPTARNQKSKEYIIITDQEIINELSKVSKGALVLSKCNTAIAVIGTDPASISNPDMQVQDLACAVENILIGATSKGFGSCYIGIYPLLDRTNASNEILNVKNGAFTFAIIALGYPLSQEVFYDKGKLSEDSIHYNRY